MWEGIFKAVIFLKGKSWQHLEEETGLWWPITTLKGKKTAHCSCPGCGERWSLEEWDIEKDGAVVPSINHNAKGCHFHAFIKLEGWVPDESAAQGTPDEAATKKAEADDLFEGRGDQPPAGATGSQGPG